MKIDLQKGEPAKLNWHPWRGPTSLYQSGWWSEQPIRSRLPYLYCWWSLVLRVFAIKRSASFSRFLEYSVSISAFFLKKSWRSCSSWTRISVCWSRHFCCSTSWARISAETQDGENMQMRMQLTSVALYTKTQRKEVGQQKQNEVCAAFFF